MNESEGLVTQKIVSERASKNILSNYSFLNNCNIEFHNEDYPERYFVAIYFNQTVGTDEFYSFFSNLDFPTYQSITLALKKMYPNIPEKLLLLIEQSLETNAPKLGGWSIKI